MKIRPYRPADCRELMKIFHDTVHTVCAKDYSPAQLDAWAPKAMDPKEWDAKFRSRATLVAEEGKAIWGFGNIGEDGYLDLLYVHRDHQGHGVGAILCDFLEGLHPIEKVTVHASETAKPFFEHLGYTVVKQQQVPLRGQVLTNYAMEKELV